jgi:predicted nucleotidyltransferase
MEILRRCRDLIREVVPGATVVLYGSRARGDAVPDSDYDLLVLAPSRVDWRTEHAIIEKLLSLELETGAVFSVLTYSEEEWASPLRRDMPLAQNVRREGITVE